MQLQLFEYQREKSPQLERLLHSPQTHLAISNSGGKDSVSMLDYLVKQKYPCQYLSIHADLELMEWQGTQAYIEKTCSERNVELVTVRAKKSLFRYVLERMKKRKGKVFWYSGASRYCTSYMKKLPINKYLRRFNTVINAVGIRAAESTRRSKQSPLSFNRDLCSKHYLNLSIENAITLHLEEPKGRLALNWFPIFDWDLQRVFSQLEHSIEEWEQRKAEPDDKVATKGWNFHYAYVIGKKGNSRLSCCYCMLASQHDLENAIPYNPIAFKFITNLERKTGFSYQHNRFLSDLVR